MEEEEEGLHGVTMTGCAPLTTCWAHYIMISINITYKLMFVWLFVVQVYEYDRLCPTDDLLGTL
jgi:hypothetical protein